MATGCAAGGRGKTGRGDARARFGNAGDFRAADEKDTGADPGRRPMKRRVVWRSESTVVDSEVIGPSNDICAVERQHFAREICPPRSRQSWMTQRASPQIGPFCPPAPALFLYTCDRRCYPPSPERLANGTTQRPTREQRHLVPACVLRLDVQVNEPL